MFYYFKKSDTGFTLIELLVVISIISLLSSIIFSSLRVAKEKANVSVAISEVREIEKAVSLYYDDTGQLPPSCDVGLVGGCSQATDPFLNSLGVPGWKGPYYHVWNLTHPWGGQIGWGINNGDLDGDGSDDPLIYLDDDRPGTGPNDNGAQIPTADLQKIDAAIDNGNLSTGEARGDGNGFMSVPGELEIIYHP